MIEKERKKKLDEEKKSLIKKSKMIEQETGAKSSLEKCPMCGVEFPLEDLNAHGIKCAERKFD